LEASLVLVDLGSGVQQGGTIVALGVEIGP
jgi:hypothetical protein